MKNMVKLPRILFSSLVILISFIVVGCDLGQNSTHQAQNDQDSQTVTISEKSSAQNLPVSAILSVNEEKIELEVANTPEQQQLGLMFRTDLPPNRGMLFPFNPPTIVNFWMKNVSISLDMIFVRDGIVKNIAHNVPPCTKEPCPLYDSRVEIDQVIELAGGRAKELNIKRGDRILMEFLETK